MEIPPCKNIIEEVTNLSELTSRQLGLFGIGLVFLGKIYLYWTERLKALVAMA